MRTDDLISLLAADPVPPRFSPGRLAGLVLLAVALPAALFLAIAGPRPDLGAALMQPVVLSKTLLSALTGTVALWLALRLARPGARPRGALLLLPLLVAAGLWLQGFQSRLPEARFADVTPANLAECMGLIVLLSLVPAAAALRLLRQGATTRPALSGALAGLAAAAGAATGYSLFCTQDNPVFYVTWYGAAMALVAAACALIGARRLSW